MCAIPRFTAGITLKVRQLRVLLWENWKTSVDVDVEGRVAEERLDVLP